MKRRDFLAAAAAAPAAPSQADVTAFGAQPDGRSSSRAAIQRAIDECAARGGGTVRIPAGRFVSGTLRLKTGVALWLDHGAVLAASPNPSEYEPRHPTDRLPPNAWECAVLLAENIERAAILGYGSITGAGLARRSERGKPLQPFRPRLVSFEHCRELRVEGVSLLDADRWTLHFYDCDHVHCHGLRIRADYGIVNNDGIDVDGSRSVVISGCEIITGDDCIVLKTTNYLGEPRPCEDVVVTNCSFSTRASALKIGTETHAGFSNIAFSNCAIFGSGDYRPEGLCLEAVDGAHVRGVAVSNLSMRHVRAPIFVRVGARGAPSALADVAISNVVAVDASMTSSITGIPGHVVRNVQVSDVRLSMAGGGDAKLAERVVPERESAYPAGNMFGQLPAYGLYVRHARGIDVTNVSVDCEAADARPAFIADDVEELTVERLRTPGALRLKDVRRATIRSTGPVQVLGPQSKDVKVLRDGE